MVVGDDWGMRVFRRYPRRAGLLLLAVSFALLAVVAVVSSLVGGYVTQQTRQTADQHARSGVDLLVGVGAQLPALSADGLAHGLSHADVAELDAAVVSGRRAGLISNLGLWTASGRAVYSSDGGAEARISSPTSEVRSALAGSDTVRPHPGEVDPSRYGGRGVLDAFEPLRDAHGRVFGVLEVSLPLRPIEAGAARLQSGIYLVLFGAALVLWLVALPFAARAAREVVLSWVPGRRRMRLAVRRALAQNQIVLVYQPQVSPTDGRCHAVEALVRLREAGQLRSPAAFLPHIEGTSLDAQLTDRVVEIALAQLAQWHTDGYTLRMSVNLSTANLADPGVPNRLAAAIHRHGCDARDLTLEVTETGVLQDFAVTGPVIEKLSALGVDLAVDDFGTGNSSIARLHRLPVREVKIDRSFVMRCDPRSRAYVAAIVGFAQRLGLRVVAEGVEDMDALTFLRDLDCDLVQGYLLSRPIPTVEMTDWLAERAATLPVPQVA